MGRAYGLNHRGEEIGYGVGVVCSHADCEAWIDKGLAHCCGGLDGVEGTYGCGGYFCDGHLYLVYWDTEITDFLCEGCHERELAAHKREKYGLE